CYPALAEARCLQGLCRQFEREIEAQFFPDGTYQMASLNYQRYVTEYLLTYLQLRGDLPSERRGQLVDIARRSVEYLAEFTDERGESLRFGDNDGAYLLRWGDVPRDNFGPLFLWAQSNCGAEIAKQYLPGAFELIAWMNQFPLPAAGETQMPVEAEFRRGGYWSYSDRRVHVSVRSGRRPPHGAGQADLLSFGLAVDGKPVVVQPGTGLYNGPLELRAYFRGALSHSGIRVDGREPMRSWGRFRYLRPATGWGRVAARRDGWLAFVGRHTGFDGLGVTYRRAFLVLRESGIAVLDCLSGRGLHHVERGLHFKDPPNGLVVAGVGDFVPPEDSHLRYGRSPSYGEIVQSYLLVEEASRELPWMGLYYLGCGGEEVLAKSDGRTADLRVEDREFCFFFREHMPVMAVSVNGEIELTEGP
ncbi:MAG: heparinase II/III-family protein, partial [Armatimonadota bacterium]